MTLDCPFWGTQKLNKNDRFPIQHMGNGYFFASVVSPAKPQGLCYGVT